MIPPSIKVGGYTVWIQFVRHTMTDEGNCGSYNARTKTITIDPDLNEESKYGIFMHELVEAIKDIYFIECLREDHHAINLLGEAFHQVMRDNGEVILP